MPQLFDYPCRIAAAANLDGSRIILVQEQFASPFVELRNAVTADHNLMAAAQRIGCLKPKSVPEVLVSSSKTSLHEELLATSWQDHCPRCIGYWAAVTGIRSARVSKERNLG